MASSPGRLSATWKQPTYRFDGLGDHRFLFSMTLHGIVRPFAHIRLDMPQPEHQLREERRRLADQFSHLVGLGLAWLSGAEEPLGMAGLLLFAGLALLWRWHARRIVRLTLGRNLRYP